MGDPFRHRPSPESLTRLLAGTAGESLGITITEVLFRAPGYRPRDNVRCL